METSLKMTSFNCAGVKFRNFDYIKETFNKWHILFLQETWLHNFQHNQIKQILPKCQYHAVSAMEDADVHRVGRPYGGVAIVWKNNLPMSFVPIETNSQRICAVHVKSDTINCVLASIYMPTDDDTNTNFYIYGDFLYELSSIIALYDNCDFIFGGDFNVDYSRINSRNLNLFKHFVNDEDLSCPSVNFLDNNYTREDSDNNRSFIDHFLLSKNVRHTNFTIKQDGHNLSDHHPISIYIM